jgi:hypothetical protein
MQETSDYDPFTTLLNATGHNLKLRVRCLIQLINSGAGQRDGGLFTPEQLKWLDCQSPTPQR